MGLKEKKDNVVNWCNEHDREILLAIDIGYGVIATISAGVMTPIFLRKMDARKAQEDWSGLSKPKKVWETTKIAAPCYAAPAAAQVASIAAACKGYSVASTKIASYSTALALTKTAFEQYKGEVVKQFGEKKEQKIVDGVAQANVNNITEEAVALAPSVDNGTTLFMDSVTGRLFYSTHENIKQAEVNVLKRLPSEMWLTLNDFYAEIDHGSGALKAVKAGETLGFSIDCGFGVSFSSCLTQNGTPVCVVDYDYEPSADYKSF